MCVCVIHPLDGNMQYPSLVFWTSGGRDENKSWRDDQRQYDMYALGIPITCRDYLRGEVETPFGSGWNLEVWEMRKVWRLSSGFKVERLLKKGKTIDIGSPRETNRYKVHRILLRLVCKWFSDCRYRNKFRRQCFLTEKIRFAELSVNRFTRRFDELLSLDLFVWRVIIYSVSDLSDVVDALPFFFFSFLIIWVARGKRTDSHLGSV